MPSFENSKSKFVKIAQPTGTGTGTPPSPPPPGTGTGGGTSSVPPSPLPTSQTRSRFTNVVTRGSQPQRPTQNLVEPGSSKIKSFAQNLFNLAGIQGESARNLILNDLMPRSDIIDQMLGQMDEDLVAKYFNEFLFVKDIPWSTTSRLMQLALDSSRSMSDLKDALDFALVHYDQKRNLPRTEEIMRKVAQTQSVIPLFNIFEVLKKALENKLEPMSFLQLGPENRSQVNVLNQLISLSTARPQEDIEELRIRFQKNLDSLEREEEISDRYRGILSTFLTDEFNRVMERNVKFVRQMFGEMVKSDQLLNLRRMLTLLKLGQELKNEFFADIEQVSRAKKTGLIPKPGQTSTLDTFAYSNNKFIKVAQAQNKPVDPNQKLNEAQKNKIKPLLDNLSKFCNKLNEEYNKKSSQEKAKYSFLMNELNDLTVQVNFLTRDLNKFTISQFNTEFYKIMEPIQELSKLKPKAPGT